MEMFCGGKIVDFGVMYVMIFDIWCVILTEIVEFEMIFGNLMQFWQ